MTRLMLVVIVATASVATAVTHHHRRQSPHPAVSAPSNADSDRPFRTTPSAAGRSTRRAPLPAHLAPVGSGWRRWLDVTAYCATGNPTASGAMPQLGDVAVYDRTIRFGTRVRVDGNVYTVTDWIGHGSDIDIYMGAGSVCAAAAARWGRRHLEVVEVIS